MSGDEQNATKHKINAQLNRLRHARRARFERQRDRDPHDDIRAVSLVTIACLSTVALIIASVLAWMVCR